MRRRRTPPLQEYPEAKLRRIVKILGEQTAAAGALADIAKRRAAGEDVVCYLAGNSFFVGPRVIAADEREDPECHSR